MCALSAMLCSSWVAASDAVTVEVTINNQTTSSVVVKGTYCVDVQDCAHSIDSGKNWVFKSNSHSPKGTNLQIIPHPPSSVKKPNPANGTMSMTFGFEPSAQQMYLYSVDFGNPNPVNIYPFSNWCFSTSALPGLNTHANPYVTEITIKPAIAGGSNEKPTCTASQ